MRTEVEKVMQKDGEKVVGRDRKAAVMRTGDGENTGKRRDGRRCKRAGKSGGKKGGARWEERCGDETRGERGTAKEVQKALSAIELNLQSYIYIYIQKMYLFIFYYT